MVEWSDLELCLVPGRCRYCEEMGQIWCVPYVDDGTGEPEDGYWLCEKCDRVIDGEMDWEEE